MKLLITLAMVIMLALTACSGTFVNEDYYCRETCGGIVTSSHPNMGGGRTVYCTTTSSKDYSKMYDSYVFIECESEK